MQKIFLTCFVVLTCFVISAQSIQDLKQKNESNASVRTKLLDLLRSNFKEEFNEDAVFVVEHFKLSGNYAWFEGEVQLKNGSSISTFIDRRNKALDDEVYDCCSVKALFQKVNNQWTVATHGFFPTDVWYICIVSDYPNINQNILSQLVLEIQESCN
jgi:hypothetical protein